MSEKEKVSLRKCIAAELRLYKKYEADKAREIYFRWIKYKTGIDIAYIELKKFGWR